MKHLRRIASLVVTFLVMAVLGASLASAAPSNAKNAEIVALDCDGYSLEVVVNGNGTFTPGHVVGSNQKLIPVSFEIVASDQDGEVIFQDSSAKGGQRNGQEGSLVTCTFSDTFEDPDLGLVTFSGEVVVFMTPRNQ